MDESTYGQMFQEFKRLESTTNPRFLLDWQKRWPCLTDDTQQTPFDAHYLYSMAWGARVLATTKPELHFDISSWVYFSTIVSAFIPMHFYEYRPAPIVLSGHKSEHVDILHLPFEDQSVKSLSCMHVVEHIGLGRYGDPLNYDGDMQAMSELRRVVGKGGTLLFVVPMGQPCIYFNAHRVYSYDSIREYFSDFRIDEFAFLPNDSSNGLLYDPPLDFVNSQTYGCGCFQFTRL